jgi:uncharacterized integral membrane protein
MFSPLDVFLGYTIFLLLHILFCNFNHHNVSLNHNYGTCYSLPIILFCISTSFLDMIP